MMMAYALLACGGAWSQIEPHPGDGKTWVLASGSEFRLPPPPAGNSATDEIAWLHDFVAQRNEAANQQIAFWDAGSPSYRWVEMATKSDCQPKYWFSARHAHHGAVECCHLRRSSCRVGFQVFL